MLPVPFGIGIPKDMDIRHIVTCAKFGETAPHFTIFKESRKYRKEPLIHSGSRRLSLWESASFDFASLRSG